MQSGAGLLLAQPFDAVQPHATTTNEGEPRLYLVRAALQRVVERSEFFAHLLDPTSVAGIAANLIPFDVRAPHAAIDAGERAALVASLMGGAALQEEGAAHAKSAGDAGSAGDVGDADPDQDLGDDSHGDAQPTEANGVDDYDADAALFDAPTLKKQRTKPAARRIPGAGAAAFSPTRTRLNVGGGVQTLDADRADALDDDARGSLIPIKGSDILAVPDYVNTAHVLCDVDGADHAVRVEWDSAWRRATRAAVAISLNKDVPNENASALIPIAIALVRIDATRFKLQFERGDDTTMFICGASDAVLEPLFCRELPGHATTTLQSALLTRALLQTRMVSASQRTDGPLGASHVPIIHQQYLAQLCQARLRLHVLATGSVASHAAAARPLAFDDFTLKRHDGTQPGFARWGATVRGVLHPTSASCVCGAHHLPPIEHKYPSSTFTGASHVHVVFDFCGANLEHCGSCPIHREGTLRAHDCSPNACVAAMKIRVECRHDVVDIAQKRRASKVGLNIEVGELTDYERTEFGIVLSSLAEYEHASKALRAITSEENAADVLLAQKLLVELADDALERRMVEFGKRNPTKSQSEFPGADLACVDLLRRGATIKPYGDNAFRITGAGTFSKTEKRVANTALPHYRLMPRHDAMPPPPPRALPALPAAAMPRAQPAYKAPKVKRETLTEYLDVDGIAEMRRQIRTQLAQEPSVGEKQRASALFFDQYITVLESEAGSPQIGPRGITVLPLRCTYLDRNNGGRKYAVGRSIMDTRKGEARTAALQAAPREVRAFLTCRFCRDFDMTNAHQTILLQMQKRLTWQEPHTPAPQHELARWVADRPEYIEHICEFHQLPTDEERWADYRKDKCKLLILRLVFGGQYAYWLKDMGLDMNGPKSPRILALSQQLDGLRNDVFTSVQWSDFYKSDYARLLAEGKKKTDKKRKDSIFARIAQKIENDVLEVMRSYIALAGRQTLTLCFDGLMVREDEGATPLDLEAMQGYVYQATGFQIGIVEKALFSDSFPTLCLKRS